MSTPMNDSAPKLPTPLFDARCKSCWMVFGLLVLVALSFWSLDLQWERFASMDAMARMGKFIGELLSPNFEAAFVAKVALGHC